MDVKNSFINKEKECEKTIPRQMAIEEHDDGVGNKCKNVSDCLHEGRKRIMSINVRDQCRRCCTLQTLKDFLPILKWAPLYRLRHLQGDIIAGLTVGLTVLPQGLAYAQVAELPAQYGLYSAFMGCFIYCFLGTSKDITLGPTAIMSLMVAQFGKSPVEGDATIAIVLCLACGIVQLLMGIFRIGFIVDFISHPVISSFTSAAAITIAFGQIKQWLGLHDVPREFIHQVIETFAKIPETKIYDMILGLVCMIILYGMKKLKQMKWNEENIGTAKKKKVPTATLR